MNGNSDQSGLLRELWTLENRLERLIISGWENMLSLSEQKERDLQTRIEKEETYPSFLAFLQCGGKHWVDEQAETEMDSDGNFSHFYHPVVSISSDADGHGRLEGGDIDPSEVETEMRRRIDRMKGVGIKKTANQVKAKKD